MPSPVSIAFITSLPHYGGGEKWMLQAATAMKERGHRVCLVGRPEAETLRRGKLAGLHVIPVRMGGWLDPVSLINLRKILIEEKVTVACVNLDKEIRLAAIASMGIPGFRIVPRRGSPDPIKNNWHYRYFYQKQVDRLIINCQTLVDKICHQAAWFDQEKVRVIYNGVNAGRLVESTIRGQVREELGLASDKTVVSLIGEVGWRKGQEILLQAAHSLKKEFPKAVFLIAGEGDGFSQLTKQAQSLGLDDGTVQFLGFRRDIPEIMNDSDILVLPSRSEGLPNTLLEGMAFGLPIIATRVDGIPELVNDGETGLLVDRDDVSAFTEALRTLLADPDMCRTLGTAGKERIIENFSEEKMFEQIEDCLTNW